MITNIVIYSALNLGASTNREGSISYKTIESIGVFSAGQFLYDKSIWMLPTKKLRNISDYVFPMALQTAYNQILYPDKYKKLILELAAIFATISASRVIHSENDQTSTDTKKYTFFEKMTDKNARTKFN